MGQVVPTLADERVRPGWASLSWASLEGSFQALPALVPLIAVQDAGPGFDQPRQHLEDRNRGPALALASAETAAVQLLGDARGQGPSWMVSSMIWNSTSRSVGVLFQMGAVAGHLQTERDLGVRGRCGRELQPQFRVPTR